MNEFLNVGEQQWNKEKEVSKFMDEVKEYKKVLKLCMKNDDQKSYCETKILMLASIYTVHFFQILYSFVI